jgi:DNA-binding transcriptional ArsR family regulator
MKPTRLLAIASMLLMVALTTVAQQPSEPAIEAHLKVLTEKLGLTKEQQAKTRPILQEMSDAEQKIKRDDNLSHKERLEKVRPLREEADKKLRKILNDDQKVKLDQLEHQPHPELHDNLSSAAQN